MSLFYRQEHTTCYNYQLQPEATFKVLQFKKSQKLQLLEVEHSVIVFLLEGEALITCNSYKDQIHKAGEIALLPRNSCCYVSLLKDTTILSCSFVQNIDFCSRFSFEHLLDFLPKKYVYNFKKLPVREVLNLFFTLVKRCLDDGLNCVHYHELMQKELFIILRAYYTKEELATFFYPLLGKDMGFKDYVMTNYLSIKDIPDFARQMNLSVDTFKRRFKEAFGESAHKWITLRKSELIYRDLVVSEKTFTEITTEYGFSSQAYLSTFCKKYFDKSPRELRDKRL